VKIERKKDMDQEQILTKILTALQNANELKKIELEIQLANSQFTGDQFRSFNERLNNVVDWSGNCEDEKALPHCFEIAPTFLFG